MDPYLPCVFFRTFFAVFFGAFFDAFLGPLAVFAAFVPSSFAASQVLRGFGSFQRQVDRTQPSKWPRLWHPMCPLAHGLRHPPPTPECMPANLATIRATRKTVLNLEIKSAGGSNLVTALAARLQEIELRICDSERFVGEPECTGTAIFDRG